VREKRSRIGQRQIYTMHNVHVLNVADANEPRPVRAHRRKVCQLLRLSW